MVEKGESIVKIGFVSMPLTGHLNPMTALARKLQSRGHEVIFIGVPDVGPTVRAANLKFVAYCETEFPEGSMDEAFAVISKLHGMEPLQFIYKQLAPSLAKAAFENLAEKLQETGIEALVLDNNHRFIELVPMSLNIPYVQIWNILHIDGSGSTPPAFVSWPYEDTPKARTRNIEVLKKVGALVSSSFEVAKPFAEKVGLNIDWSNPGATASKLAIITQTPKEFDLPGFPAPGNFIYAGPFYDSGGRERVPFPWDKLSGKPLVYASLGSLVNGLNHVYKSILDAVEKLPHVQVVLSIGKNLNSDDLGPTPSNVIVVRSAPQIELLEKATLCITHAGLNTTLEALGQGVPMVAIPIGFDQPGVAARIAHHGVGEFVDLEDLTTERLLELILKVLENPSYRDQARYFQTVIARTRGREVAAEAIEKAFNL
jgi:zeaxanthin glucosyltransferase